MNEAVAALRAKRVRELEEIEQRAAILRAEIATIDEVAQLTPALPFPTDTRRATRSRSQATIEPVTKEVQIRTQAVVDSLPADGTPLRAGDIRVAVSALLGRDFNMNQFTALTRTKFFLDRVEPGEKRGYWQRTPAARTFHLTGATAPTSNN